MIKFMLVALGVMLLMQSYVSWHVWRVLPFSTPVKITILLIMLAALACMVLQFKSDGLPLNMATAMYEIGNSWLIIMFYLLMAFLLLDIGRMVHIDTRRMAQGQRYHLNRTDGRDAGHLYRW